MYKLLIAMVLLAAVSQAEIKTNHPTVDEKVKYGEFKSGNSSTVKHNRHKSHKKVKHTVKKDVMSQANHPDI